MVAVSVAEITWEVSVDAWKFVQDQSPEFLQNYSDIKAAFKSVVWEFVNLSPNCDSKALGVSPLGGVAGGGKIFKVRVAVPGGGKRGGLRVICVAFCASRKVIVLQADLRRDAS